MHKKRAVLQLFFYIKLDLIELFEKLSVIIPKKTKKPEIVENITTYIQSAKYIPEIKD